MASVFSFDPDPPKMLSPWDEPSAKVEKLATDFPGHSTDVYHESHLSQLGGLDVPLLTFLADRTLTRLKPEPQQGPIEYKLHLLLRPRRSFSKVTRQTAVSDPQHRSRVHEWPSEAADDLVAKSNRSTATTVPTLQVRQNRLQHLTTQLLWRLQQSSPYHSTSAADLVLPRLPEATVKLGAPSRPEKLLSGLEESRGALYEIGVTDDGAFVGLSEEEMSESLTNLRAMAASLGCSVRIMRCVVVGHCEWVEMKHWSSISSTGHQSSLLVTEALVFPDRSAMLDEPHETATASTSIPLRLTVTNPPGPEIGAKERESSRTEQLRVSLTGRSAAGKSSLLGTLSTSTYDNGRGKSRLSMLKHRHEIASGMTSSVASELIGYSVNHSTDLGTAAVINYGCGNVSSWDDIHNAADGGRLVFLTDSAGHPRYRRTTVRGLVSWAPHWTLCCIAGSDDGSNGSLSRVSVDDGSGQEDPTGSSFAHLELCLELGLPLVVIVTKHDLVSRDALRQTLSKILSMVKAKQRKPMLLVKPSLAPKQSDLQSFSAADQEEVVSAVRNEPGTVPILLTSAVSGSGIRKVHALLCSLPVPQHADLNTALDTDTLFHIDEVYGLQARPEGPGMAENSDALAIASGYQKSGTLVVGDTVYVGPFSSDQGVDGSRAVTVQRTPTPSFPSGVSSSPIPRLSQSMPREENIRYFTPPPSAPTPVVLGGYFLSAKVVSLRNLRLPVKRLLADQAGTVGIAISTENVSVTSRLRKGMVIRRAVKGTGAEAIPSFAALRVRFDEKDYLAMEPGALFNLYVASVRAAAKIVSVAAVSAGASGDIEDKQAQMRLSAYNNFDTIAASVATEEQFAMDERLEELKLEADRESQSPGMIDVLFRFLYTPEWVELGAKVLAMPGQAVEGGVGLEGFVGHVTDTIE